MYSEACQDEFVNLALGEPKSGFFVDVGAVCYTTDGGYHPHKGSNTFMFEQNGWSGVAIDMNTDGLVGRKCNCLSATIGDGTKGTTLLGQLLREDGKTPDLIDYLSVDIEGQDYNAVRSFHESGYRFKVATIEHNLYSRNQGVDELKRDIFLYLTQQGYLRVVDNAGNRGTFSNLNDGWPYEDWYIDPMHVNYRWLMEELKKRKV